jgi:hypothetical protein
MQPLSMMPIARQPLRLSVYFTNLISCQRILEKGLTTPPQTPVSPSTPLLGGKISASGLNFYFLKIFIFPSKSANFASR